MDDTAVLLEKRTGYYVVTLNRPQRLNAFTEAMHVALQRVLDEVEADQTCRALLLTGAGRGFCTGQDLNDRLAKPGETVVLGGTLEAYYNPLVRRLRALPFPVVAAVNGVAAGAGANVALACDIVMAARSATFVQSFARIGLIPDFGGTYILPRLVGAARARALALTAEPLPAEQAAAWGMIWKVTDDDALMAEAEALCARFAKAPTAGLALIKRALDASWDNDLDAQLDLERELQREASLTPDYAEGVRAFLEKRPPAFTGRREVLATSGRSPRAQHVKRPPAMPTGSDSAGRDLNELRKLLLGEQRIEVLERDRVRHNAFDVQNPVELLGFLRLILLDRGLGDGNRRLDRLGIHPDRFRVRVHPIERLAERLDETQDGILAVLQDVVVDDFDPDGLGAERGNVVAIANHADLAVLDFLQSERRRRPADIDLTRHHLRQGRRHAARRGRDGLDAELFAITQHDGVRGGTVGRIGDRRLCRSRPSGS